MILKAEQREWHNLKKQIVNEMVKSIISLMLLVILYTWSAYKLHLTVFLFGEEVLNFFLLYVPTLIFFSSLFLDTEGTFKEVQRLVWYSFVPVIAFRIGWYGYSFYYAFPICYIISNIIKPNFKKRYPIIVFNGIALLILLIWRAR